MIEGVRSFGVDIQITDNAGCLDLIVTPPPEFTAPRQPIDCGLAGTVMRFLPAFALQCEGQSITFTGDEHASKRPMSELLDAFRTLGVCVDAASLPFTMRVPQRFTTRQVMIDSSRTSQYISALLLVGARLPNGLTITHTGDHLPSQPHIDMTIQMLAERGVDVEYSHPHTWSLAHHEIAPIDTVIEPDLTNAAVFLAAAAVAGGTVRVAHWPQTTTQAGDQIRSILAQMGAQVSFVDGDLSVQGAGTLTNPPRIDLSEASELAPVVAGLVACGDGVCELTGIGHIRGHETDRLAAISAELNSLGVFTEQFDDGLRIHGCTGNLTPSRPLRSYADHRMVHMACLVSLRTNGLEIEGVEAVSKTMPDFCARWEAMLSGGNRH